MKDRGLPGRRGAELSGFGVAETRRSHPSPETGERVGQPRDGSYGKGWANPPDEMAVLCECECGKPALIAKRRAA